MTASVRGLDAPAPAGFTRSFPTRHSRFPIPNCQNSTPAVSILYRMPPRIAQGLVVNALTRPAPDRAAGDGLTLERLHQAAADGPDADLVRMEFRREVFRWAADRIRDEFRSGTWDAFWLTAIEDHTIDEA